MSAAEPRHLTERQLAAALLPGAEAPVCPVPGCTACPARLEEAQRIARQFHDEVLPRTLPNVQGAGGKPHLAPRGFFSQLLRPWALGGLAAAAAALIFWVKLRPRPPELLEDGPDGGAVTEDGQPYLGVKGSDDLGIRVYVWQGERAHRVTDGFTVHPGDSLRFVLDVHVAPQVLVVSIDGAQQISVYYPFGGDASAPLPEPMSEQEAGHRVDLIELPDSVELDATLGDERLWVILSDAPLPLASLRPRLERLAAGGAAAVAAAGTAELLEGLPGTRALTLLLHKEAAPR